jgi:hypothetical protein
MLSEDVSLGSFNVDACTAEAFRSPAGKLRRQLEPVFPHAVFPALNCQMAPVFLKAFRREPR